MGQDGRLTRRELLGAAAMAGGSMLAASGTGTAAGEGGLSVTVAAEGSAEFGPQTPGTRTSGIQEAIEAVHARGGGMVCLKSGVYPVSGSAPPPEEAGKLGCGPVTIRLYEDTALLGEGKDRSVIRVAEPCNTNTLFAWEASRIEIADLTLEGGGLNAGYGVAIFGMGVSFADIYLRRVRATGFGGSAIAVAGGQRVTLEQCAGLASKIGFELGSPSRDYVVLHCTAYGCTNGTLVFDPGDQYNEAGNLYPQVIGGVYDGEGTASGLALWDCWQPLIVGVTARRGVTTNIQVSASGRKTITTPVGGGLIEACLAEGSVGSPAGRYGIGACQEGVRVTGCTVVGNEDTGVLAAPGEGGAVSVGQCTFRAGAGGMQRHAIGVQGRGVILHAQWNTWDGAREGFVAHPEGLAVPGSCLSGNGGYNPVGMLAPPPVPASGEWLVNTRPFAVEVYLTGGRVGEVSKRDLAGQSAVVAKGAGTRVLLQPGEGIAVRYTRAPRWAWFGE